MIIVGFGAAYYHCLVCSALFSIVVSSSEGMNRNTGRALVSTKLYIESGDGRAIRGWFPLGLIPTTGRYLVIVMEGNKGPSSLPCILARDGEDLGFMSLPMGKEEGEGKGKEADSGRGGGVLLRGGVWVLHERLLASWKERYVLSRL